MQLLFYFVFAKKRFLLINMFFRKQLDLQAKIADAFLERYQLKPHEMKALRVSKDSIMTEVRIELQC